MARADLLATIEATYGRTTLPAVYLTSADEVRWSQRLLSIPDAVVAVPATRPLRSWIIARPDPLAGLREYARLHAEAFGRSSDWQRAQVEAVAVMDPFLADIARLWRNGSTQDEIGALAGLGKTEVQARIEYLRRLGFDLPHRRRYHRRGEVAVRFETPVGRSGVRRIG